jgi:L-2-hydroxyglutarate oxidase LhgO
LGDDLTYFFVAEWRAEDVHAPRSTMPRSSVGGSTIRPNRVLSWLRCDDPAVNRRHRAKVYGKPAVGSPPISVSHLDTRVIGGQHSLLFGPYAGFSSKFLEHASLLDLVESIRPANIEPLLAVARDNFDLTEYLIEQMLQSESYRLATPDEYYPKADPKDWRLQVAGQRVQIIKPDVNAAGSCNSAPSSPARRILPWWRCSAPRLAPVVLQR